MERKDKKRPTRDLMLSQNVADLFLLLSLLAGLFVDLSDQIQKYLQKTELIIFDIFGRFDQMIFLTSSTFMLAFADDSRNEQ